MKPKHAFWLSTCLIPLASIIVTALTIVFVSAQDRRPERRQDRDPSRTNVHCEVGGFVRRANTRIDNTLEEADQWCKLGDTIVLDSPVLVARLCDFSWSMVTTGSGATVCVFGGVRELR